MSDRHDKFLGMHAEAETRQSKFYWFRRAVDALKKAKESRFKRRQGFEPIITSMPSGDTTGDAKITWMLKPGSLSHAEKISKQGRTACGLKIGKKWKRVSGVGHPGYRAKCSQCKANVKT